jgi:hypothetical protein
MMSSGRPVTRGNIRLPVISTASCMSSILSSARRLTKRDVFFLLDVGSLER